jgi:hypothetical protein
VPSPALRGVTLVGDLAEKRPAIVQFPPLFLYVGLPRAQSLPFDWQIRDFPGLEVNSAIRCIAERAKLVCIGSSCAKEQRSRLREPRGGGRRRGVRASLQRVRGVDTNIAGLIGGAVVR